MIFKLSRVALFCALAFCTPASAQIGPIPGMGPIIVGSKLVVPVATNLGNNATTCTITTATNVPAGSLIVVETWENQVSSDSGSGTVGDNGGNSSYTNITTQDQVSWGNLAVFYVPNASLASGKVITYTKADAANVCSLSAFYATGIAASSPVDTSVTAQASLSGAPSLASGTPASSGDLFVAAIGYRSTAGGYTQDTTHNWVTPFTANTANAGLQIAGGSQVNVGLSPITFAPTIPGTGRNEAVIIVGFKHQ